MGLFIGAGLGYGLGRRMSGGSAPSSGMSGSNIAQEGRVREVEHQIERLMLLNQSLWELLREKLNISDADLQAKIQEVDMRDGVADGKMTTTALKCPTCGRTSSSKHWKCLYCGQQFEKPIMG